MDREAWGAAIHGVAKRRTRLSNWTELNWGNTISVQYMYRNPWIKDFVFILVAGDIYSAWLASPTIFQATPFQWFWSSPGTSHPHCVHVSSDRRPPCWETLSGPCRSPSLVFSFQNTILCSYCPMTQNHQFCSSSVFVLFCFVLFNAEVKKEHSAVF